MPGIFLSYRRDDSQGEAHHLFDDLVEHFGHDRVFMDVAAIAPGLDFRKAIDTAVAGCDVLIVMIGKDWLDAAGATGKRRLDDPNDFVRAETAAALKRDVPTIPVLVQGAAMPRAEELPKELEPLAWRNAFEVRHARWQSDVAELVKALKKVVKEPGAAGAAEPIRPRLSSRASVISLAGLAGVAVLAGALAWLWQKNPPAAMGELEYDVNRYGSDYGQPVPTKDPATCQDTCARDTRCVAFSFVKPGLQGASGMCWLKSVAPPPIPNTCCISGLKKNPPAAMGELEYDVNRYGGDYGQPVPTKDPATCQDTCARDTRCVAFSFVKPGLQGASGMCWLKSVAPPPIPNTCCISGLRLR